MQTRNLRELVLSSLFVALIAIGAIIRIPLGSTVYTLQFLATLLAGALLGGRLGALAVLTYTVMGLVGLPVFAPATSCSRLSAILWLSCFRLMLGERTSGAAARLRSKSS